ncbi:hypothetical protein SOVF_186250 isoform B [Spinacia oleracea]|nr:hypothetical protein SOVF_186250 isoform B [Spinacia oleracea]
MWLSSYLCNRQRLVCIGLQWLFGYAQLRYFTGLTIDVYGPVHPYSIAKLVPWDRELMLLILLAWVAVYTLQKQEVHNAKRYIITLRLVLRIMSKCWVRRVNLTQGCSHWQHHYKQPPSVLH